MVFLNSITCLMDSVFLIGTYRPGFIYTHTRVLASEQEAVSHFPSSPRRPADLRQAIPWLPTRSEWN